jgi:hypothetical protein
MFSDVDDHSAGNKFLEVADFFVCLYDHAGIRWSIGHVSDRKRVGASCSMNIQTIVALSIVVCAMAFLIRRIAQSYYAAIGNESSGSACGNCRGCKGSEQPLVDLTMAKSHSARAQKPMSHGVQ